MKRGVIVDLDGTLLQGNSFEMYVVFVMKEAFKTLRFDIVCELLWYVGMRRARIVSHKYMKYYILRLTRRFMTDERLSRLVDILATKIYLCLVEDICSRRLTGCYICMATAAPDSYAQILASRLGFDACCATSMPNVSFLHWKENKSEEKLCNIENVLQKNNVDMSEVFTDHIDDLPILRANRDGQNFLVNPSPKTISLLTREKVRFTIYNQ